MSEDLIAQALRDLAEILSEMDGQEVDAAFLNDFFSRFCVGK